MSMENIISQKEKLTALVVAATRKTEVQALLADTRAAWELARAEVLLAETRLADETADVERLGKISLPNLFLTVTGKMGEKRETEEAEAAEAREAHRAAADRAEDLHRQVSALEAELRQLGNCDKDLETLAAAVTAEVLAQGGELADEIAEIKARAERNTAEAEKLEELLTVGERLNRIVGAMLPILWNAEEKEKRRLNDDPLPPYSHRHVFKSEVNAILDEAETYLPMLISLAESFTTDIMDIPPLGSLQTVKSTFDGTYTASTLTQIERTEAELEALAERVNSSMEKIRRVRQTREEAASALRAEWIRALIR